MGAAVKGTPTSSGGKRGGRSVRIGSSAKRQYESPLDQAKPHEVIWDRVAPVFEVTRSVKDICYLYVIGEYDDGPIKIGHAINPITRIRGMQTGNPRRLRIEYLMVGDRPIEKLLQEMWEPFAIVSENKKGKVDAPPGTEWFRPEVREHLLPVVATIVEKQLDHLDDVLVDGGVITSREMERCVREAHGEHGVDATRPHEVRLLASHAGYFKPGRKFRI